MDTVCVIECLLIHKYKGGTITVDVKNRNINHIDNGLNLPARKNIRIKEFE